MRPALLISSLLVLLAACATERPRFPQASAEYGATRERQVFFALTEVKADDVQRAAVLAAFDVTDPKLKVLAAEAASNQHQLQKLDPKQADYLGAVEPIAQRRGQIDVEKLLVQAQFNQALAKTLSSTQYETWTELFRTHGESALDEDDGPHRGGGRRGG